jgi:hypothetical protein
MSGGTAAYAFLSGTMLRRRNASCCYAIFIGEGFRTKPLIWQTLCNSIAFLIFVAGLTVIEEVIVGFIHGQTFWRSMSECPVYPLKRKCALAT